MSFAREKYPNFVYEGYKIDGGEVKFHYSVPGQFEFQTVYVFPVSVRDGHHLSLLGVVESLSYWKAFCSKGLHLKIPAELNSLKESLKTFIINGMGEYFYQNRLPFTDSGFLNIILETENRRYDKFDCKLEDKLLLLASGGKDTALSANLLRKSEIPCSYLLVNPNEQTIKMLSSISPKTEQIVVKRSIDKQILELNQRGFLNGHVPFSASLALAGLIVGRSMGFKWVAASNERSSDEGNVEYLGRIINHQYSKTFEFESTLRTWTNYISERGHSSPQYFSLLRPLYEIQIAELLSRYTETLPLFLSCNRSSSWCGKCPKCLSVFIMLSPFVDRVTDIFGADLGNKSELIPVLHELVGLSKSKPFECVGTYQETLAAIKLAIDRKGVKGLLWNEAARLVAESKIDTDSLLSAFSNEHLLPSQFEGLLKNELRLFS